jgi:1-aminocyclopropane-1-carboxylate deaminase
VDDFLTYHHTPVQELKCDLLEEKKVKLLVKREDLNHPFVSGNKWWKLKYNFHEAHKGGLSTVLTFGGAYSNHIYATAAAARELGFNSIGIIRGEEHKSLNDTLAFAASKGMNLYYVSRTQYRDKQNQEFLDELKQKYGDVYIIPEGGTNLLAVKGCIEFGTLLDQIDCDYIMLPVGTAGTMSGLVAHFQGEKKIIGVPVLKNSEFLKEEIKSWVSSYSDRRYGNWDLLHNYHHGGYAKTTPLLLHFIKWINDTFSLPLDHVYTGKLLFAIFEEIKKGSFPEGSRILMIHTGGMQGASRTAERA